MRCDQVEKLLIEFADGELNAGEHAAVSDHLQSCDACAAELASLERMKLLLRDDGYEEPSSFYWTRFNARLRERTQGGWLGGDDRWAKLVPRLAPVVVAVAFFAVGMWLGAGALNMPATPGGEQPSLVTGASFAEAPVVSARSKLVVDTGGTQPTFQTAADTLAPDTFDPYGDGPGMVLTGTEEERRTRYLGESLIGD
jgi:anti-sigma factor RsiW